MPEIPDRMRELVRLINQANYQYYRLDKPSITDLQWDALYDELNKLEEQAGFILPDSPTRRVGGDPLPAFVQHTHLSRLWSMDKVQTPEALAFWFGRMNAMYAKFPNLPPL